MKFRYFLTSFILSVSLFSGVVLCSFVRSDASGNQVQYVTYADYEARSVFLTVVYAANDEVLYSNKEYFVVSAPDRTNQICFTSYPVLDFCMFDSSSRSLFGWHERITEYEDTENMWYALFCPETDHELYRSETDPMFFWESESDTVVYVYVNSWNNSPNQSSGFSISGWWSWATGLMLVLIAGLFIIFCSVKSRD